MWQILPSIHGKYSEFLRSKNMPNVAKNPGIVANCGEIFSPHCPEILPQCHLQEQRTFVIHPYFASIDKFDHCHNKKDKEPRDRTLLPMEN